MKSILLSLLAIASATYADLYETELSLTKEDLFVILQSKTYDLDDTQIKQTRGMDCIVSAVFTDKNAWVQSIPADSRSYVGVLREHEKKEANAFSCAGGTNNELLFNRSQPGSEMSGTAIYPTEQNPYVVFKGQPVTLQQIHDSIVAGNKVALALLRTPSPDSIDMMALTIWDGTVFTDYVVGCEIASSDDTVGLVQLNMDDSRFVQGYTFLGKNYGVADIVAANHYALTGIIPEPAAASLGILALAGLSMRRRRC